MKMTEELYMKKCLHQIIRPSRRNPSPPDGVGECVDCETDENNKQCKCYTPVSDFQTFQIKKNEGDK